MTEDYLNATETYKIIGILFEVHKNLGKGFSEIVYKDALEFEFQNANIPYEREKEYAVHYKNTILKHKFYADFVVFNDIILEIKASDGFSNNDYDQCLNYLKVSGNELAISKFQCKFIRTQAHCKIKIKSANLRYINNELQRSTTK